MFKNNFVVVLKHRGKILRDINEVVEMPFGTDYSILLKNKSSKKAVASVEIDGEDVLDGNQIIIPSNDSVELKGFMKNKKVHNKFRFIEKTKEISDYRGDRLDDGLIRVEYRFEKTKTYDDYYIMPDFIPWKPFYRSYDGVYSNNTVTYSCNNNSIGCLKSSSCKNLNYDEGITVKGAETKQNFVFGNTDTLEKDSTVITLKLKGTSIKGKQIKKPIAVSKKKTCTSCGRKWKSINKFCGRCGTYLD